MRLVDRYYLRGFIVIDIPVLLYRALSEPLTTKQTVRGCNVSYTAGLIFCRIYVWVLDDGAINFVVAYPHSSDCRKERVDNPNFNCQLMLRDYLSKISLSANRSWNKETKFAGPLSCAININ